MYELKLDWWKRQELEWQKRQELEWQMRQDNIADIMNAINDALEGIGYEACGYENKELYLTVMIEKRKDVDPDV